MKMYKSKIYALIIYLATVTACARQTTFHRLPVPGSQAVEKDREVFTDISVVKVKQKMDQGENITLLDVRSDDEYRKGHLKNAVHIPIAQLKTRIKELDPGKETIVYCHSGYRSRVGSDILVSSGFSKVRDMGDGIDGWIFELVK